MTTPATTTPDRTGRLRAWAAGSHPVTAAVELLVRAFHGRFATDDHPWIRHDPECTWIDDRALARTTATGPLSGGERRILALVTHLLDPAYPIDLPDILTGIDRTHLDLALAALAHAAGSHEHADIVTGIDGRPSYRRLGPLHPWPDIT